MLNYVLGLDGGGTKTLAEAADLNGNMLFRVQGGALNPNGESPETVKETLKNIILQAAKTANGKPAAICVGAAGISNPKAQMLFSTAVENTGFSCPLLISGDNITALTGALGKPEGIILISGTGSICTGRTDKLEARAGGYGHLIDDEGSGYAMGRDVLHAVIEEQDGRGPTTCLTDEVYKQLNLKDASEIVGYVYSPLRPKSDIALFAKALPKAAEKNDLVAIRIYEKAAKELVRLAVAVVKKLNLYNGEIAFAGSALLNDEFLRNLVQNYLVCEMPNLKIVIPKSDAAHGAALLALDLLKQKEK